MARRRKLTPLQTYRAAAEKRDAAIAAAQAEFEATCNAHAEAWLDAIESIIEVQTDDRLTSAERLKKLKALPAWPRIVLGLYLAELKIAQAQKDNNPVAEPGEPSDTAYNKVGAVVGLGADRIKQLCDVGRRQLKERQPAEYVVEISAAEFERRMLRKHRAVKAKTA